MRIFGVFLEEGLNILVGNWLQGPRECLAINDQRPDAVVFRLDDNRVTNLVELQRRCKHRLQAYRYVRLCWSSHGFSASSNIASAQAPIPGLVLSRLPATLRVATFTVSSHARIWPAGSEPLRGQSSLGIIRKGLRSCSQYFFVRRQPGDSVLPPMISVASEFPTFAKVRGG